MSLFNIKIVPIVKEREWEVRNIGSNRKVKDCAVCGNKMRIGDPSTTFTKRVSKGIQNTYTTVHTCNFNVHPKCALKQAEELGINLDSSFVN